MYINSYVHRPGSRIFRRAKIEPDLKIQNSTTLHASLQTEKYFLSFSHSQNDVETCARLRLNDPVRAHLAIFLCHVY
jgi:hypothetical protein